jgi:dolichol kinase
MRLPFECVLPFVGILALGVADSAASVAGTWFGRTKWSVRSPKSVEGTVAAVFALIGSVWVIYTLCAETRESSLAANSWKQVLRIASACTGICVFEAVTDQLDNLYLPLYGFAMFQLIL